MNCNATKLPVQKKQYIIKQTNNIWKWIKVFIIQFKISETKIISFFKGWSGCRSRTRSSPGTRWLGWTREEVRIRNPRWRRSWPHPQSCTCRSCSRSSGGRRNHPEINRKLSLQTGTRNLTNSLNITLSSTLSAKFFCAEGESLSNCISKH